MVAVGRLGGRAVVRPPLVFVHGRSTRRRVTEQRTILLLWLGNRGAGDRSRTGDREGWTLHRERVGLETTLGTYGGACVWFTCPGCGSRRAVLFSAGGVFACRSCHDLAYSSTREDAHERSLRRCQAIQKRLGGGGYGVPVWDIPGKPAGMHWETYERLVRELRHQLYRQDGFFDAWLAKREAVLRSLS